MEFKTYCDHIKPRFEEYLINSFPASQEELLDAMRYSVLNPAKRIRAIILIKIAEDLGGDLDDAFEIARVIEYIHCYSLIHDDLPSMDNDDYRRGMPSCHKKFGEWAAILAGDALLTLAFEVLSSPKKSISDRDILRLNQLIANSIGYSGMAGGQYLDLKYERSGAQLADIIKMQELKTAKLFAATMQSAAIIANKHESLPHFEQLGLKFGLLYQIRDDLLDINGSPELVGKTLNKDTHKATLIKKIDDYNQFVDGLKVEIFNISAKLELDSEFIGSLIDYIIKREY